MTMATFLSNMQRASTQKNITQALYHNRNPNQPKLYLYSYHKSYRKGCNCPSAYEQCKMAAMTDWYWHLKHKWWRCSPSQVIMIVEDMQINGKLGGW